MTDSPPSRTRSAVSGSADPTRREEIAAPILPKKRPLDFVSRTYSSLAMVLLVPVSVTIFLVVWGVQQLTPIYVGRDQSPIFLASGEGGPGTPPAAKFGSSLLNALIIVAFIVGVTLLMVCLYKLRCMKIIIGWFVFAAGIIFFFLAWTWLDLCATRFQIPYDFVTMSFIIWNFGVVGMISVFYYAHPRLSQVYLVIMSVIMAWMLARFPEWTTWTLLIAIAIYDIVAVLCPKGPLQMLLKEAHERDEPIPGFIYDSAGGTGTEPRGKVGREKEGTGENRTKDTDNRQQSAREDHNRDEDEDDHRLPEESAAAPTVVSSSPQEQPTQRLSTDGSEEGRPQQARSPTTSPTTSRRGTADDRRSGDGSSATGNRRITKQMIEAAAGEHRSLLLLHCSIADLEGDEELIKQAKELKAKARKDEDSDDDEDPDPWESAGNASPFKLGLGDFIFYSILVGRAAVYSYVSWMICFISVLMGLIGTLVSLLFFRGKIPALPALPISIFLGTIMFFSSRYLVVPYVYYISTTGFV